MNFDTSPTEILFFIIAIIFIAGTIIASSLNPGNKTNNNTYTFLSYNFPILDIQKNFMAFILFIGFTILLIYAFKNLFSKPIHYFLNDSNYINTTQLRNEPYYIDYINPYITNLKSLDFNYRSLYNGGDDLKIFLKSKMNEFLIGKYVKFHDVLTYKKRPFEEETFNDDAYKQGRYFKDNTSKTTALVLVKSGVIKFTRSLPSSGGGLRGGTASTNYIYIFEDSDLPTFDKRDNITVINNTGSILNTRELNPAKNYVYFENTKRPEDLLDSDKFINKEQIPPTYMVYLSSPTPTSAGPISSENYHFNSVTTAPNDSELDVKWIQKKNIIYKVINSTSLHTYHTAKLNYTYDNSAGNRKFQFDNIYNADPKTYEHLFTSPPSADITYPLIQYIYRNDIDNNTNTTLHKKPIIVINKNNIKRPIYYKNNKDKVQTIKYKDWLLDTYKTFIKSQFKGRTFKIKYIYKKYDTLLKDIKAEDLKYANCKYTNSFAEGSAVRYSSNLTYGWMTESIKDIKFNENINDLYKKQDPKNNEYGFIVYLCNSSMPVDNTGVQLGFLDKDNNVIFDSVMPYIVIQHYKFNYSKDNDSSKIKSVLYKEDDDLVELKYDPFKADTTSSRRLGDVVYIKLHKTQLNDYNMSSRKEVNVDNEWKKYIYNHINTQTSLNSVKIPKQQYDTLSEEYERASGRVQSTSSYIESITNSDNKSSDEIYITSDFAFTENKKDYGIKMKLIAQTILNKYHTDKLSSIINATYNLSQLTLVPIKINRNNYIYYKDKIPHKVRFNTTPLTINNINNQYPNTGSTGIQELRTDFCIWLAEIMRTTVWTEDTPTEWNEKSLLNYINKLPYDRVSKKLNMITSSTSSYTATVNAVSESWIKIKESSIRKIPYFIKIGDKEYVVDDTISNNGKINSFKLLNAHNDSNTKNLGTGTKEIYDYTKNMVSKKMDAKIKKIFIHESHPNIFTVEFNKIISNDDIQDYYSFDENNYIDYTEFSVGSLIISDGVTNRKGITSKKIYLNITKKDGTGNYLNPTNTDKKLHIDTTKYKDSTNDVKMVSTEEISDKSTYLTFYSNAQLPEVTKISNPLNSYKETDYRKYNIFSYENKEKYHETIITEKKIVQDSMGNKKFKTFIRFKGDEGLVGFYRDVVKKEGNNYIMDYNIKDLILNGSPIQTQQGETSEFMSIEDHFSSDIDGVNLMILKTMIIINESVKVHYNLPNNIGIEETSGAVPTIKCSNELWIPYKYRNTEITGINAIESRLICSKERDNTDMTFKKLNTLSKFRLFDYEKYLLFYLKIFETITGIYTDIDDICQKNKLFKTEKWYLPASFNNYLSFDNFVLFYRNDNSILEDSNIRATSKGKPVLVNNKQFDGNTIKIKQKNSYNNEIVKKYLRAFSVQNKIGAKGYSYETALDICSRTFTAQNIVKDKCKKGEYKTQTEKFDPAKYENNKQRDKCFNIIYNTKTDKEAKELKDNGKWVFPSSDDAHNNKIAAKYKEDKLKIMPHRIAHMRDIKNALYTDMNWTGAAWTDQNHLDIIDNNSLVSLRTKEDNKKVIDIYNNPNEVTDRGVICYGRKEPSDSNVSKALLQFRQKEKEMKEIMKTLQENDDRQDFNTKEGLYSMWSN